ncbi:MAG: PAS domain-containing protein [Myxococcota bacterium]|nr:PAS domain-containing protein [Myxococcota bacterium]
MERTLLSFLDTPVVIGDPGGCAVWANPAFETLFEVSGDDLQERPLAELFAGGGRERILHAVAMVSEGGENQRFRLRERGSDFEAVVSAIEVGSECVGVVILLKETLEQLERLCSLQRQLREPIDEIEIVLDSLLEQTGGRRSEEHRGRIEDAMRSLERIRKWSGELGDLLSGGGSMPDERFDALSCLRRAMNRSAEVAMVELLAQPSLPAIEGDGGRFEWALSRMIEERINAGAARLVLGARLPETGDTLLVSINEIAEGEPPGALADPPDVRQVLGDLGAQVVSVADPRLGRSTLLSLPVPERRNA